MMQRDDVEISSSKSRTAKVIDSENDIEMQLIHSDDSDSIKIDPSEDEIEALITESSTTEYIQEQSSRFNFLLGLKLSYGVKVYILSLFLGSAMFALSKVAEEDCNYMIVSLMRMIVTFGLSFIWLVYKRIDCLFWGPPATRRLVFWRSFCGSSALLLSYYSIQFLPLSDYSVINFLRPLATSAGAFVILGESYHWTQAASSAVSLIGVVVITRPSFMFGKGRQLPPGISATDYRNAVIAVLVQVCASVGSVLCIRAIAGRVKPMAITASYALLTMLLSIAGLFITAVASSDGIKMPSKGSTWVLMIVVGTLGYFYQYTLTVGITAEKAGVLMQYEYLILVFSLAFQLILFGTLPDIISIAGGTIILLGVWASNKYK